MKFLILFLLPFLSIAQLKLKPIEPKEISEGQKYEFQVGFEQKSVSLKINWGLSGNTAPSMNISSEGVFSWMPDFKVVTKNENLKTFDFYIKATSQQDSLLFTDSVLVNLTVKNTNTPPIIPQKTEVIWIPKANTEVQKTFPKEYYFDEEGDVLAFRLVDAYYPNLKLSPDGNLSISLTTKELKSLPDTLFFEVFEQNTENRLVSQQSIILKRAEIDEPPTISVVPDSPKYQIEEGDELAMEINISDENDDMKNFDFYTIPQTAFKVNDFLEKKAAFHYLFRWKPPLDFVKPEEPARSFVMVMVATDEAKHTTTKQIEVEILNKIDWKIEDQEREKAFNQVVFNAAEVYLRLEKTFLATEKNIKKLLKNKKLRNFASRSLNLLSKNANLIKNEETQNKLTEYSTLTKDAIELNDNATTIETEYPAEFSKLNRFTNIVTFLKEIFVDTEQFIEKYKYSNNRRKAEFLSDKAELQKKISLINKNTSLQLESLKNENIIVKNVFNNL